MANLRVNKITGTEVFETTGSVQFDGNGDYLRLAGSNQFDFGTGDFTIEAFVYPIATQIQFANIVCQATTGNAWYFSFSTSNFLTFSNFNDIYFTSSSALSTGVWSHVAVSRNGTSLKMYINGIEVGSVTNSISLGVTANVNIGFNGVSHYFNGHISNLRILKGTALYTKNFTPPTRELTVIPNTVLLCCQSTTRANEERTGKTITVNGNAVANELTPGLLTDRVKSGGSSAISGSVEFDGTGDYLGLADSEDFNFGSGDFTIEAWINGATGGTRTSSVVFNQSIGNATSNSAFYFGAGTDGTSLYLSTSGNSWTNFITGSGTVDDGSWHHVVWQRNGNTIGIYLDGVLDASGSFSGTIFNSSRDVQIGVQNTAGNSDFKGFISNLRVIKGTALYTQNFIPPTRELKKLPGTVLLCCQDSTNPLQEATGKTISLNGSVTSYSVGIGTTTPNPRNFIPSVGFDGTVIFDGVTKINTPNYFYLPTGNTEDRGRGRGVFGGGTTGSNINVIQYINVQSSGNAIDFGDLTIARRGLASCSSSTRGVWGGGTGGTPDTFKATIDYVTISTTGNAQTFGNLTDSLRQKVALSNLTRGVFAGGYNPVFSNIIEYITISSTGNAQDFGDLSNPSRAMFSCSSSTRGLFAGSTPGNTIEYITISSTGNTLDFGDLTVARTYGSGCCSSSTRGVFGGGYSPAGKVNVIDYVTISSTGNAQDFGDLTAAKADLNSCSSSNRGFFAGGYTPTVLNTIEFITISSTGNAQDFGDLLLSITQLAGCSDSHGGLG